MTTISANNTLGVTLTTASYTSPVVITAGVTISSSIGGNGVYASIAYSAPFDIRNSGTISGASGVDLSLSGSVDINTPAGSITGTAPGQGFGILFDEGHGTVANAGAIRGADGGIFMDGFGAVINTASASIVGAHIGVAIHQGAGTVINAGSIRPPPRRRQADDPRSASGCRRADSSPTQRPV